MNASKLVSSKFQSLIGQNESSKNFINTILSYFEPLPIVGLEIDLSNMGSVDFFTPLLQHNKISSPQSPDSKYIMPKLLLNDAKCAGLIAVINSGNYEIIWLEFDENRYCDSITSPGVFITLSDTFLEVDTAINSLEVIKQNKFPQKVVENFKKVLLEFNTLADVGVFLGREDSPIRYSGKIDKLNLTKFCKKLSLNLPQYIVKILSEIDNLVTDSVGLDIDIFEDEIKFQGLEINANKYERFDSDPANFILLLEKLSQCGWCDSGNAQKIYDWHFCPPELKENSHIIENLAYPDCDNNMIPPSFISRNISHLKLQYINNNKKLKAYLCEVYCWSKTV